MTATGSTHEQPGIRQAGKPFPAATAGDGTAAAAPPEAVRTGQRDAFFDNAKYLAIVLVAVGHSWEPLRSDSRTVTALYMTVYAIHMPAFIILSGYFSRSFDAAPQRIRRLVTGVALPYVVFEVAYTLFTRWTDNAPDRPISLLEPLYLTWFLAALFIWRLTTPFWRTVRRPLPLALGVAMLATLSPAIGEDLDLQRVLQFLPYFVLGLCLRPEHFGLLRRREVRALALPVLVCACLFAYWAVPRGNYAWLFHRDSARELGAAPWTGPAMTLALFGCSVVLVTCFLTLVPNRRVWFTVLGSGTLYGYLLHGFVLQAVGHWRVWDHAWLHRPFGEIAVTVVAATVVTALCTPAVRRIFRVAVEPEVRWAFPATHPREAPTR